jgi:hypothetical protein
MHRLRVDLRQKLGFDDAYMFWRYAVNLRHGLGISWNLDGIHTYGETALLWGFVVWLVSFTSSNAPTALVVASWTCSVAALVAITLAVSRNARSQFFSSSWRVMPCVALPLLHSGVFTVNAVTGMETMLAMLLLAIYVGLAIAWQRRAVSSSLLAVVGLLLFLTRPESALSAVLIPVLLHRGAADRRRLVQFLGLFAAVVLLDLGLCQLYFHVPVPLSFFMKSGHGYQGYAHNWTPILSAFDFVKDFRFYLALLILCMSRRQARLAIACLVPMGLTFVYLTRTVQIMGFNARYYIPYLPLLAIPALLLVDTLIEHLEREGTGRWLTRGLATQTAVALLFVFGLQLPSLNRLALAADERAAGTTRVYARVDLHIDAKTQMPVMKWVSVIEDVGTDLIKPLPRGVSVAATEVGYLGYAAPQANIIDLAGLNDRQIALHGFSMDALLARKPDIIWFPHSDYTYQRGQMFSDPELLRQYDVYADAAKYGLAVRKDSPFRGPIMQQLDAFWKAVYPGLRRDDYLVQSVSWSGQLQPITFQQAMLGLSPESKSKQ